MRKTQQAGVLRKKTCTYNFNIKRVRESNRDHPSDIPSRHYLPFDRPFDRLGVDAEQLRSIDGRRMSGSSVLPHSKKRTFYETVEKPAPQRLMKNVQMQGFRNPEE